MTTDAALLRTWKETLDNAVTYDLSNKFLVQTV